MPRITVRGPSGQAVSYRFDLDRITIGRAPESDLHLHDPALSRAHAEIVRTEDGWAVLDRGSTNGTRLNGRPLEGPAWLSAGDEISLGLTVLVFEREVAGAVPEGAAPDTVPLSWSGRGAPAPAGEATLAGRSRALLRVLDLADRVAASEATVLITGENGTGKELLARRIHERSPRARGPFVVVNCPALPQGLVEAELFGVERGVATGVEPRPGRFEIARGGTVLLDEIGDLDPAAQAKLLRVLQERTVERVGGRSPVRLDVRILAATHHDLRADVERGAFRRDLLHRVDVVSLRLPPLRERLEDVPSLVEHFLARAGAAAVRFSPEALAELRRYAFPGNVRELENIVEKMRLLARGPEILPGDLPPEVRGEADGAGEAAPDLWTRVVGRGESFWSAVQEPFLRREVSREEVRAFVRRAFDEGGGSYKGMAGLLGIGDDYKKLVNFLSYHRLGVED